jgi:hypothetical protein
MAMKDINDLEKWEAFCKRLLQKTVDGNVQWDDWADRIGRHESRTPLFVASYKQ